MSDADRDKSGKYTSSVSDTDILGAIDQADTPVVTAAELAEMFPIGQRAIRERLSNLNKRGLVERKNVGSRAVVWWLKDSDKTPETTAPAAPLRNLVGLIDEAEADRARERSREWRRAFDDEMKPDSNAEE